MFKYKIDQQKDIRHAIANRIYFNAKDYKLLLEHIGHKNKDKAYIQVKEFVYLTDTAPYVEQGSICLSKMQRENLMLSTTMDHAKITPFNKTNINYQLSVLKVELKPFRLEYPREIKETDISKYFRKLYQNHFFGVGQSLYFDYAGIQVICRILNADLKMTGMKNDRQRVGLFTEESDLELTSTDSSKLKIKADSNKVKRL